MINTLNDLVTESISKFGVNISGILYYGSSLRNENNLFSDQDLLMTVKDYDTELLVELRHIVKSAPFFVDLPVIFESEIPTDPERFRLINHGCYFLEILKRGQPIYGRNVFLDLGKPSPAAIQQSLLETIVEYTQFFRRNFVESNRERSLAVNYQLNRRLIKGAYDLLWIVDGKMHD
ncbi:MAG: hypothetical protein KW788_04400, partial [Candidatus Doudnabacteria bacterium]|nr:hypothetical protein [Candidatus Doudnabacteria bacterium]